jgi:phospholipid/cholesterol/gamma-HCH transport system substrate-binding protein
MATRAQKVRLGIFMLLSFLALAGSVLTLAGLRFWNPKDRYYVHFKESVAGLESGAAVRMKGVQVGQVEAVTIDPQNVEEVVVSLALKPDTPVKADARAVITSVGITGLKFVELTGGSSRADSIKPNTDESIVKVGSSEIRVLTGQAKEIGLKMEKVLANLLDITNEANRTKITSTIDSINLLAQAWTNLATDNSKRVKRILLNVDRATATLDKTAKALGSVTTNNSERITAILVAATSAAKSINRATQGLRPQAMLNEISKTAKSIRTRVNDPSITAMIKALNRTANRIAGVSSDMAKILKRRDRQFGSIMVNLDHASRNIKAFTRIIKERPSLLLGGDTRKERRVR